MRYLLLLWLLSGCAARNYDIDPAFLEYANRWEAIYGVEVETDIRFADLKDNTVGLCSGGSKKVITIDAEYWNDQTDFGKEELIFHEFGHCLLNLGHDNSLIMMNGVQIPKSIMYPYTIGDAVYAPNRDYYREELKTSKANED